MNEFKFITTNSGKVRELQEKSSAAQIKIVQVKASYPELQADTLIEIVRHALVHCKRNFEPPFIIEDSGLFITDLNDFPGPYSAYVFKTLGCEGILKLAPVGSVARFDSVLGLCDEEIKLFEGTVRGTLANPRGTMGFGFDPIFEYHGQTFAEMNVKEKNLVSHRGQSMDRFIRWTQKLYKT